MPVRSWKYHSLGLALSSALVLLLAWISGHALIVILTAALMYTGWQVLNLLRLNRWMNDPQSNVPESFGLWADLFDRISSFEQNNRREKDQYRAMIGEFQNLTDAFPDASLVIDENNSITWFNTAAGRILKLRKPDDLGQPVTNLLRDPDFANWLAVNDEVQSGLEMSSPVDDNTWLDVSSVAFGENQRLIMLRDVSNIHQLEKVRRDFVANISHELRTPLTVLLGYLEVLQDQPSPSTSEAIDRMHTQATRMREMLNDLLELSRLQSDEISSEEQCVDVPIMMSRLQKEAKELNRDKCSLSFKIDDKLQLSGVASDLESAFHNLILNAIKYTPENGKISIRWQQSADGPVFSVRDNGIGIPKRDIPRLTERFYRVGSDRARQSGGTGLGLAIVKHVLKAHQARLVITSELGKGSKFTCIFPSSRSRTSP